MPKTPYFGRFGMKNIILVIFTLFPFAVEACNQANRPCMNQRNSTNTLTATVPFPVPASDSVFFFDTAAVLPKTATMGAGCSLAGGVLSCPGVQADWTAVSGPSQILNQPTTFTPSAHSHVISDVTGLLLELNDRVLVTDPRLTDSRDPLAHNQPFSTITSTPTTLAGYGISDGVTSSSLTATLGNYATTANVTSGLAGKENLITAGTTSQYWRGDKTFQTLDKASVGLSNVDNTSDANKPVSAAVTTALAGKFNTPLGTTAQYVRGDGSLATFPTTIARSFSYPTRAVNTCFQLSNVQDAEVRYNVDISTTLSLVTGQRGTVYLRHYTNNTCTLGAQDVDVATNGNTGSLTVGLNLTQTITAKLTGIIPAGKWVQIVTENTTGTPTFTARLGAETLI